MRKIGIVVVCLVALAGCAPQFTAEQLEAACSQRHAAEKRALFDAILADVAVDDVEANYDSGIITIRRDANSFATAFWLGAASNVDERLTIILLDVGGETMVRLKGSRQVSRALGWGHSQRDTYQALNPEECNSFHANLRTKV